MIPNKLISQKLPNFSKNVKYFKVIVGNFEKDWLKKPE